MFAALLVGVLALAAPGPSTDVKVVALETQSSPTGRFFLVRVQLLADLVLPIVRKSDPTERRVRRQGQLPTLVSLDDQTRLACLDIDELTDQREKRTLTFVGRRVGTKAAAKVRLVYPVTAPKREGLAALPADLGVATATLILDWSKGKDRPRDDDAGALDRVWGNLRLTHLQFQHERSPGSGFFALAGQMHADRHGLGIVHDLATASPAQGSLFGSLLSGDYSDWLFELTTGATALTESLALRRFQDGAPRVQSERTVEVTKVRGIEIAAHPWEQMMGGRKPLAEPLARLIPHDNYYLTVRDPFAFVTAWSVLDTWGGSVLRSPRLADRDYGTRVRYERQLCLPAGELLQVLPAGLVRGLVRGLAITGSDLFWTEGTDVTVLFDVTDPKRFLAVHDRLIARANWGQEEGQAGGTVHRGVRIEGFTRTRREVSLYRSVLGAIVVCSNSPTAIRHVIDVQAGARKALADALDFQYMRTVFRRNASQEDGFAFLSDAFVRRLVGPATRIKQARRQQARAALTVATHAALTLGIDSGYLPSGNEFSRTAERLPVGALAVPEEGSGSVDWGRRPDSREFQAFSRGYNTLEFTTPLVELPIDRVTPEEERDYDRFRTEYLRLWRRFFDPVGIRFKLGPGPARVEVYLLPLIENNEYNELRRFAGEGTVRFSPSQISNNTQLRYLMSLPDRSIYGIGRWALIHIDRRGFDLLPLVRAGIARELNPPPPDNLAEFVAPVPALVGMGVTDADGLHKAAWSFYQSNLRPEGREPKDRTHRGVAVKQLPLRQAMGPGKRDGQTLDWFLHDGGAYLTWSPRLAERWIDHQLDQGKAKPADSVEVNTSIYLAPPGGKNVEAISAYLEWETHKRALANVPLWQALCDAGVVTTKMSEAERGRAVRRLLGYVPVSPDGSPYLADEKLGVVRNQRHGSPARPEYHGALAPDARVLHLLSQLRNVRADLRFREDGIHTTLTIDWDATRK